ncbi:MAG: hypothetical protein A2Y07_01640 [Planctomycetes bacterium GWF2_50_10]|nr:MAG: hypothetical protein A2Y07_01640 [Planctomycetes bacterium GWF2_50_10]
MDNRILHELGESLLFTRVFKTFRMSIQPAKLSIALGAIAAICIMGLLMDLSKPAIIAPFSSSDIASAPRNSGLLASYPTELHAYISGGGEAQNFRRNYDFAPNRTGVFNIFVRFSCARFTDGAYALLTGNPVGMLGQLAYCGKAIEWALVMHTLYSLVFFGLSFVMLAIAGGAICRLAALEFANDEKPGFFEAMRFASSKARSLVTAPAAPVAMILLFGVPLIMTGLLGNIPWHIGEILMSVMLIFGLTFALLMTLLFIGALGGINMMLPAIAYESTDSFEAISRSFAYVFARPWRLGFYTLVAAVYGAACYVFVQFFAMIALGLMRTFLRLGVFTNSATYTETNKLDIIWPRGMIFTPPMLGDISTLNWSEKTATVIISIFVLLVLCMVGAFVMSFFFSANSVIYALMRNVVDKTSLKDVWTTNTANPEPPPADQLPKDAK